MFKLKYTVLLSGIFFLTACGSSGGNSNDSTITLADMVGVWDDTREDRSGNTNIEYIVIKNDGARIDYDYQGDSSDNGANCYEASNYSFLDLGNGTFQLTFPDGDTTDLNASIFNDVLTWSNSTESISFPKINLNESDFIGTLCTCDSPSPNVFEIEVGHTCDVDGENYSCLLDNTVSDSTGTLNGISLIVNGNTVSCSI
ncbi:MAG: hypothetical protein ACRBCI_07035 [Cellvibrionaceae bacterium]